MGLIDLKTNLRSLSYGTGRGEPYITRPLPAYDEDPGNPFLGLNMFGRAGQLGRGLTDVKRLTKYLGNGKGLLFNAKQIALEKTRPKVPYGPKRSFLFSTVLAQAGVQGTGIHFDRANNLNVSNDQKYDYLTRTAFSEENTNRLTLLYNSKIVKTNTNPLARSKFGITGEGDETTIINYGGGPNSIGGLGRTTFVRSDRNNTSNWDKRPELKNKVLALTPNNLNDFYKDRSVTTGFTSFSDGGGITNFVLALNGLSNADSTTKKRILGRITRYDQFNRAKTFKTGDQGKDKLLDRQAYYTGAPQPTAGTDSINFKKVYSSTEGVNFNKSSEDMIKFYIAVLDNNNPEKKTYIHFRAYVEGIQDNYTANWNSVKYPGRGESFYKYSGFDRDVGFSFKVHVSSRAELFPTYQKLNYLASIMTPDYSSPGYMRGNIVELTLGDYFNDVPGVITNFSYNISDETSWDIARNNDGTIDENSAELATLISVDSFSFRPIHKFLPKRVINPSNPQSKFISLGSDAKGYTPAPAPAPLNPINPTPPTPTLQLPS